METSDTLNLIAIIVIPIAAVLIGQWLQNHAEKRKDKMQIFKTSFAYIVAKKILLSECAI